MWRSGPLGWTNSPMSRTSSPTHLSSWYSDVSGSQSHLRGVLSLCFLYGWSGLLNRWLLMAGIAQSLAGERLECTRQRRTGLRTVPRRYSHRAGSLQ